MPNGHRDPYRFQLPDIGDPESETALSSWSDLDSSDSDETFNVSSESELENKIRFLAFDEVAHKVLFRWKFLVWRNKRRRRIAFPNLVYQVFRLPFPWEPASCIANFSTLEIAFQNQSSTLGDVPYVSDGPGRGLYRAWRLDTECELTAL